MIFKLITLFYLVGFWFVLRHPKAFCKVYRLPASLIDKARPPCGGVGKGLFLALEIAIAGTTGALGYQFGEEARASDPATVARAIGIEIVEVTTTTVKDMTINNPAMKAITE